MNKAEIEKKVADAICFYAHRSDAKQIRTDVGRLLIGDCTPDKVWPNIVDCVKYWVTDRDDIDACMMDLDEIWIYWTSHLKEGT